ncbi:unnamed protein product [Toxocara canis]|uniref:Pentapeptide repeat-containing protein n=1 Tax=Toxocara canis TaxID=6265 RepID=A0A183TV03_TOXCA|nr:unnamed protein product [Toxocara canis]
MHQIADVDKQPKAVGGACTTTSLGDIFSSEFRFDSIRFDSIRFDSIRFDSIRFDSIRFDSIRFDSIRFDSINWNKSVLIGEGNSLRLERDEYSGKE